MRAGESEPRFDCHFDCLETQGTLKRAGDATLRHLRLETFLGEVLKTVLGSLNVPSGLSLLAFNTSGTLIARPQSGGKMLLIPPRSATFLRGPVRMTLQAARGTHQTHVLSWQNGFAPLLDHWVTQSGPETPATPTRAIACKPIAPHLGAAFERFEAARDGDHEIAEPLLLSVVHEAAPKLLVGPSEIQLAITPSGLPETIQDLIREVQKDPSAPWPLKEAADRAGYSPFHFSRVFKAMVGYGFHEYVDRSRTGAAVDMLVNTDSPVDLVASSSGFGTTQGLRESIKEYLGLVPSELRATPDPLDTLSSG